jgi:hypothetical protein
LNIAFAPKESGKSVKKYVVRFSRFSLLIFFAVAISGR